MITASCQTYHQITRHVHSSSCDHPFFTSTPLASLNVAVACSHFNGKYYQISSKQLLGARTVLGPPGLATRSKKLLGAPGLTPRSKKLLRAGGLTTRSKKLLGAPGLTTGSKKLPGAPGLTTRSKDATRGSWPYY